MRWLLLVALLAALASGCRTASSPTPTPTPPLSPTPQAPATAPSASPTVTTRPTPTHEEEDYGARLVRQGGWATNIRKRTVPLQEVKFLGLLRDQIPPIDKPQFETPQQAQGWLEADEPVLALEIKGDARAYPLRILLYHEIVNDQVGGEPVAITY